MRRRLRDSDSVVFTANTEIDGWLNAGCQEINRVCPFKLTDANIDTDGSASSYSMVTPLTGFLSLRSLRVIDAATGAIIPPHPRGVNYIDEQSNASAIVAGTPAFYAFEYPTIYFDMIPDATLNVKARYYAELTSMTGVAPADVPDGLLAVGNWDKLILGMACIQAASDIQDEKVRVMEEIARRDVYGEGGFGGELGRFIEFVAGHAEKLTGRGQIHYSDLGDDIDGSQPRRDGMTYGH